MTQSKYQFDDEELRYIFYVKVDLAEMFDMDENAIEDYINNSSFLKVLSIDPEFTMDYNTDYWASKIFNEYNTRQLVYR